MLFERAVTTSRQQEDLWYTINALRLHGVAERLRGNQQRAKALLSESLKLCRGIGDRVNLNWLLHDLGAVASSVGDRSMARILFEESLAVSEEVGDRWGACQSLLRLGSVAQNRKEAAGFVATSLRIARDLGASGTIRECLVMLAGILEADTHAKQVARLYGTLESLGAALECRENAARAQNELGEQAFSVAYAEGAGFSLHQAADYALGEDIGVS